MAQEPFGDIPLFRELQRLLSSSEGPINLAIADQVAQAIAESEGADNAAPPGSVRAYGAALRDAELLLSGYTRIPVEEPTQPAMVTRAQWVTSSLKAYSWLMEHFALKMMGSYGGEGAEGFQQMPLMQQVVPLLTGLQVGALIGHLSKDALGRHDLPIPRDDDGKLYLVYPNASTLATGYGFDAESFRKWMALRDVGRHLVIASSAWVPRYLRSAFLELIDSIEVDVGDVERRLMDLQEKGVEALQGARTDEVLPIVQTERHQMASARLQAFVVVLEGYASHAAAQVGTEIVPEWAKIDEGMARRDVSPSEGREALTRLLGLSLDRSLRASGVTFCAAVVKLKGIAALNEVWTAPDNLPSLAEIRDPFQWIERVLD